VRITDVMYTLKRLAVDAQLYQDSAAPGFSQTFVDFVENYGRSFEVGLATRYYLRHHPLRLPGLAPKGLGMLSKGRMDLKPHRIEGIGQLKAILARAKALEATA
jgi:hypothetical protein